MRTFSQDSQVHSIRHSRRWSIAWDGVMGDQMMYYILHSFAKCARQSNMQRGMAVGVAPW